LTPNKPTPSCGSSRKEPWARRRWLSERLSTPNSAASGNQGTVRQAMEGSYGAKPSESYGLAEAALGLGEQIPYLREMGNFDKLKDSKTRGQYFGEMAKSLAVPQFLQWLSAQQDVDAQGETVKRKPQNIGQYIESGIPGMRQDVPTKQQADFEKRIRASFRRSNGLKAVAR